MILADLCVRRPVFATMFVGVLVVLGWFSYMRLGVDLFPKVDVPTVMVTTFLPGAAPEETEARVTKPLEEAVNTVSGIDEMRSNTLEGVSRIMIQFKLERDLDAAVQDVRDKISTVLDQLPDGTKPPLVQKFDLDAVPVVTITLTGYQSLKELTEMARRRLKEPLESVDGVGSIDIVGGREREVHVDVDADKLHATGRDDSAGRRGALAAKRRVSRRPHEAGHVGGDAANARPHHRGAGFRKDHRQRSRTTGR